MPRQLPATFTQTIVNTYPNGRAWLAENNTSGEYAMACGELFMDLRL